MERTVISQRFALAPVAGRRSAPGTALVGSTVVPVPTEGESARRGDHDLNPDMRLAKLGARFLVESALAGFKDGKARIVSLLDGSETTIEVDDIVTSLTNVSNDSVARDLQAKGAQVATIGDCIAARHAAAALYDGRRAGVEI